MTSHDTVSGTHTGLKVDGIVGKKTWPKFDAIAEQPPVYDCVGRR